MSQLSDLGHDVPTLWSSLIELVKADVNLQCKKEQIAVKASEFGKFLSVISALVDLEFRTERERTDEIKHRKVIHARTSAVMKGDKLKRAKAIVREHWEDSVSVTNLAKKHNLTPSTIYKYLDKFPLATLKEKKRYINQCGSGSDLVS